MPRRGINLSEDEWRVVKSRAAANGLTVSAYIARLIAGLQDFTSDIGPRPEPPAAAPGDFSQHTTFGASRPAPKPGKKR